MSADATGGRAPTEEIRRLLKDADRRVREFFAARSPVCTQHGSFDPGCDACDAERAAARSPHSGPPPIDHGGDDPYGLEARNA